MEVEFEFEQTTKNTYRFREKGEGEKVIRTLYMQKSAFRRKNNPRS